MAELSLRAYIEYIENRLERDAFAEVVAQSRHVLSSYPKYVEAYKSLARALVGQEKYTDALDMFQRVLSANPSDFVAHIGMSECYKEDGALDQAIWHLERAFEQVPNSPEIQDAIRQLYEQRDGKTPRKIQMNNGALARMYAKGNLAQQAITELTKALNKDPERLDLQTVLADTLWQNHQEVDAGKVAAEILNKLPHSVDANRILAQLWLRAGQPREARHFIDRVKELDPYTGYRLEHNGEPAPADSFRLTLLEYTADRHASQVGAADWVSEIKGIDKQKSVTGPLKEGQPSTDVFVAPSAAATPPPPPGMDAPDWLKDIAPAPSAEPQTPSLAPPGDAPDWLQDVLNQPTPSQTFPAVLEGDAPDWLADIASGTPSEPLPPSPSTKVLDESLSPTPPTAVLAEPVTPSQPVSTSPTEDAPDWLKDMAGSDTASMPSATASTDEAPDWLAGIASSDTGSMPPAAESSKEESAAPASGSSGDTPDWLQDVLNEQTPAGIISPLAQASDEPAKPAWLEEVLSEETRPPAAVQPTGAGVVSEDALEDLIKGGAAPLMDTGPVPPVSTGTEAAAMNIDDLGELEGWDAPSEPAAVVSEDDVLVSSTESAPIPVQETAFEEEQPVVPPSDDSNDIPDWLSSGDLDSDDALKWLEEMAARIDPDFVPSGPAADAGASIAEPAAAVPEPEPVAEVKPPEPVAEVVPITESEAKTAESAEELPDWLTASEPESAPAQVEATPEPAVSSEDALPDWLGSTATPASSDEDLDWLRKPAEEPASVSTADDEIPDWLTASEPAAVPESAFSAQPSGMQKTDESEELKWLDDQVAAQGVKSGEPLIDALTADHPPMSPRPIVPDLDAEAAPATEGDLPDWLKEAGASGEIAEAMDTPAGATDLADLPDMPVEDDELAWLNDALKSEEESSDELADLFAETGGTEEIAPISTPEFEPPAKPEPEPVAEAAPPEPAPAVEVVPAAAVETAEELPDWLKEPETPKSGSGLTDFLTAIEPAVAEAPVPTPGPPEAPPPPPAPAPVVAATPPAPAPTPVAAAEASSKLQEARTQMSNGELPAALTAYEALVTSKLNLDDAINDLQEIVKNRVVVNPRVFRVLGDALMGTGKVGEAMEMYRRALDQF
jgi:tetratricopeptide (TPR) repeat protein